jgi:hypothetical protein
MAVTYLVKNLFTAASLKKKKKKCAHIDRNLDWFLMGKGELVLEICPWHSIVLGF